MLLISLAILLSAALLAILIALTLLVERDDELVIAIKLNLEIILRHTWRSNLNLEFFVGLDDIDLRWCRWFGNE